MRILSLFLLIAWAITVSCFGADIFVDADGVASVKDGSTWYHSFNHLQDALAVANSGDEIHVAAGVYFPDRSAFNPVGSNSPEATFSMLSGVSIRGGYAGVGASDPNYRDFEIHESILSGDLGGNDSFSGSESRNENISHVVTANGVDSAGVLEGFRITGGNAISSSPISSGYEDISGGGIYISGGEPRIIDCLIIANYAFQGGGLYIYGSNPRVINCRIISNWAFDCGAGIFNTLSNPSITNCVISGNVADDYGGGGLWNGGGTATLINCTFNGNWDGDSGNGIFAHGGLTRLINCIVQEEIWVSYTIGARIEASNSNVPSGFVDGVGNINVDPGFVDAFGVDGIAGTVDDNLRLGAGSKCIDSGDPSYGHDPNDRDLDGKARISNGVIDMGAYEYVHVPSLIGRWKLDEIGGMTAMDSAGANDGSTVGNPVWHPEGRVDGSLDFDGVDDYVNCGADSVFDIRNEITVSAWIKVGDVSGGWRAIVTKGDSAWRLQFAGDDDKVGVLEFACTGVEVVYALEWGNIIGNKPVNDGKWHHAVGVYDGLTMALYVDGELDSMEDASGLINTNTFDVLIGENAERPGRTWDGRIDDVRVYDYALNADEIYDLSEPETIYHVDINGGDNLNEGLSRGDAFKDIAKGIDKAENGDTVLVWPGVYDESVLFNQYAITVRSAAEAAIIRASAAEAEGYAFTFFKGNGSDTVLSNFVICDSPGAVYCSTSSPTLKNLTIVNNDIGIEAFDGSNPEISNCIFWNNTYGNTEWCESVYSWDWQPEAAVAHWRFNEGEGTIVNDLVGSNHGTVYNALRTDGESGGALHFDGDLDYVWVPNSAAISVGWGVNNYTLSAWVKPDRIDGIFVIMSKMEGHNNKEYMLSIDDGRIRLDVERDNNNGREYSDVVVKIGSWQHVAVTFDKSNLSVRFFYNGVAVGKTVSAKPITMLPYGLGDDLCIGMRGAFEADPPYIDGEFRGSIDEVMIFDRILSDRQLEVVYKSTLNPQFADPSNNDYHLMSDRGRYVPLDAAVNGGIEGLWAFDDITSPCVDGGDPTERPESERMPNGGRVNMGAYGNTVFASMSEWTVKGDVNRDGVVDVRDLAIMAADWLGGLSWAFNE